MYIDKFMSMINTQLLYFPKITEFQDIYEGVLTKLSREEVYKTNLLDKANTPETSETYARTSSRAFRDSEIPVFEKFLNLLLFYPPLYNRI